MTDLTTADILRKARDHIAQPGMWWQQGGFSEEDAMGAVNGLPCCAWGALMWAKGNVIGEMPFVRLLNDILYARGEPDLHDWNDTPGRTQAEVVALFDKAIELAEQEARHG